MGVPRLGPLLNTCPGCGYPDDAAPPPGLPTGGHTASPSCYWRWMQLLARDYADPAFRRVHQLSVDAWVAQHSGGTGARQVRGTGLCLMTLALVIEDGVDPATGPRLHVQMLRRPPAFVWLAPPAPPWSMSVHDVLAATDAAGHEALVRRWGAAVWAGWVAHHDVVRGWNRDALAHRR